MRLTDNPENDSKRMRKGKKEGKERKSVIWAIKTLLSL